jgi:N-methylhydantoinase A
MDQLDWALANRLLKEMSEEGRKILESSGLSAEEIIYSRTADMRYIGQGHEVSVPLPGGMLSAASLREIEAVFENVYRALYGRKGPDVPLEVINWRVVASGPRPAMNLKLARSDSKKTEPRKGSRLAYFPERGGYVETAVYDRYSLTPGTKFAGPAIVEERESTLIVGAKGHAHVDEKLNIVVEFSHEE